MTNHPVLRFQSVSEIADWTSTAAPLPEGGRPLAARRKILLAYDTSRLGDEALQWTFDELLRDDEDHLVLVTAVEPTRWVASGLALLTQSEAEIRSQLARHESAVRAVQSAVTALCLRRGISTQTFFVEGDARDVILDVADRTHADVIVVGARGLGAVKRAVLGSTSQFVSQNATVPVVIVKQKAATAESSAAASAEPVALPLERTKTCGTILDWISLKDKAIEKKLREEAPAADAVDEE
ncbi:hypothetical protein AMAG_06011 [Allomyces macrogynus ATCC 38327]|uniref:UspA domain-containing protein n=1 Tax=Allomyces macrogynus (strain ATCC 38327) TaxID=578462 RepID=A0A0L0SDX9_ALLM3|nr:hypothetical protein AMAG_06011 [Allomyces macrogynus ATCC 38327]|eukprot:KNE60634.1 hypothetical protein AMAG_06011 [Allomyces macrogynus ATCC 38327]